MPKGQLVWDEVGERKYETGIKKGVLYVQNSDGIYPSGVAWNGLREVTESPSGAEATAIYADDIKYLTLMSAEELGGTIGAYMSPPEFDVCDGTAELVAGVKIGQQKRKAFGMSYVTSIGNDIDGVEHGYKIHLLYGALASPSEKNYATINESPEAMELSWEFTTTPVNVTGHKPTALVTIDSTKVSAEKLAAIEAILYGSEEAEARLPLPDEIATLMAEG